MGLLISPQFNHILIDCHPSLGQPNSLEQVDNTAIQEVESPVHEHDAIVIATKQVNNLTCQVVRKSTIHKSTFQISEDRLSLVRLMSPFKDALRR